jgi:hypothetical protein
MIEKLVQEFIAFLWISNKKILKKYKWNYSIAWNNSINVYE